MPGVAAVCMYSAASLGCGAVGALVVFLPLLALDQRRADAEKLSWLPCLDATSPCKARKTSPPGGTSNSTSVDAPASERGYGIAHDSEAGRASRPALDSVLGWSLGSGLARALSMPLVALVVVTSVCACAGLSGRSLSSFEIGLSETAALPPASHVQDAIKMEYKEFGGRFLVTSVVFENVTYTDRQDRTRFLKGSNEIDRQDFLFYRWPLWLHAYEAAFPSTPPGEFTKHLGTFLDDPAHTRFQRHVDCDSDACLAPRRTRLEVLYSRGAADVALTHARRDAIEKAAMVEGDISAFAWNSYFLTTAIDEVILDRTITHMFAAAGAAAAVLFACVQPSVALCGALSIGAAVANLLGMMFLLGLPLTFISYTIAAMNLCFIVLPSVRIACSYGEAVDKSLHANAAAGFPHSTRNGSKGALQWALRTVGASVARSAAISVCGLAALSGAQSVAFIPFFIISTTAVGMGAAHALIFLPALLSLLGAASARAAAVLPVAKTSPEEVLQ